MNLGYCLYSTTSGAFKWHISTSRPHHFSFQIPRKQKGFSVDLVGGDTFCDTNDQDKCAVFAQKKRDVSPS